jgi:hypothetical protein
MQEQPFRCPECGASFPTQKRLEEHVELAHRALEVGQSQEEDPAETREFPSDRSIEDAREQEKLPSE